MERRRTRVDGAKAAASRRTQATQPTPGELKSSIDQVSVTGERILNWAKFRSPLQQPHQPGLCGRCIGRSYDTQDLEGRKVWFCGKCDVVYG